MKKIITVILFLLILAGCQHEPMIKLSPERQQEVEAKLNQTSQEIENPRTSTEAPTDPNPQAARGPFDASQFTVYEQGMVFTDMIQFIPNQPNQIKVMTQDGSQTIDYMDFVDPQLNLMQIREETDGQTTTKIYYWDSDKIVRLDNGLATLVPISQLVTTQLSQTEPLILLHGPLQVGTSWQANTVTTATITSLYQEASFNDLTFNDVIEVTYQSPDRRIIYYFAKDIGFVASEQIDGDQVNQVQVTQLVNETTFTKELEFFVPKADSEQVLLSPQAHAISWQTNGQLASAYTQVFQAFGWLNQDVMINHITLTPETLVVDFSPGIVASLNQHPDGEEKIIPAIVTTMSQHFQVDSVTLTVNQMGLLPDTLPYPAGGQWFIDSNWLLEQ